MMACHGEPQQHVTTTAIVTLYRSYIYHVTQPDSKKNYHSHVLRLFVILNESDASEYAKKSTVC